MSRVGREERIDEVLGDLQRMHGVLRCARRDARAGASVISWVLFQRSVYAEAAAGLAQAKQ